jgi:hypothetical protein
MHYRFCDLSLRSNIPLPELHPAAEAVADLDFEVLPEGNPDQAPTDWFHHREMDDGRVWLTFARQETGYLLRFSVFADFMVSYDRKRVRCLPKPGLPSETIRHFLLDQVLPLVISQRGALVLHASAVATPHGAIAFIGDTGRGKSTLATCLTQLGHSLLTDDCLVVREQGGEFSVLPTYPSLRVKPNTVAALLGPELVLPEVAHYSRKKRLGPESMELAFAHDAVPLRRLFFLGDPRQPPTNHNAAAVITRMPAQQALVELIRSSFRLDCLDRDSLLTEFEACGHLARSPLVSRLDFQRDFKMISALCATILAVSAR